MTYEEWKNRPVYKAQCVTWRRACELTRIPYPENEEGLALPGVHPICTFRALPGYRDAFAKALRDMVALSIKMDRFAARMKD